MGKNRIKPLTFKVNVTTTPTKAFIENPSRVCVFIQNTGSNTIYLITSENQTYDQGVPIEIDNWLKEESTGELWLLTASGTSTANCKEDDRSS